MISHNFPLQTAVVLSKLSLENATTSTAIYPKPFGDSLSSLQKRRFRKEQLLGNEFVFCARSYSSAAQAPALEPTMGMYACVGSPTANSMAPHAHTKWITRRRERLEIFGEMVLSALSCVLLASYMESSETACRGLKTFCVRRFRR